MPLSDLTKTHLLLQYSSKFKRLTNNKCQPEHVSLNSGFSSLLQTMATQQENYVWFNNVMVTYFMVLPGIRVSVIFLKEQKMSFLGHLWQEQQMGKTKHSKSSSISVCSPKICYRKCTVERNISNFDWKIQANKHYSSISTLISSL